MYPVLLSTPWFNVYSYGFMLAIGYTVFMALTIYQAKKNSLDTGTIFDLMLMQLIVGVIGSRLLFVLEYTPEKLFSFQFLAFEQGGLTFYGCIISAFIFDLLFLKLKKMPFWKTADCMGFGLGIGIAISRIGCFLNGCCFGTPCSQSIGFRFRGAGPGYFHATQLYESILSLVAFAIIFFIIKKRQTHYGQIFLSFIILYGFFRFFIEFLRIENPIVLFGMTLSQILSIIFISLSIIVWRKNLKNKELQIMPDMSEKSLEK